MKREEPPGTVPASPIGSTPDRQGTLARRKRLRQIGIPYMFLLPFLILLPCSSFFRSLMPSGSASSKSTSSAGRFSWAPIITSGRSKTQHSGRESGAW